MDPKDRLYKMHARLGKAIDKDMGYEPETPAEDAAETEGAESAEAGLESAVKAAMDAGMSPEEITAYVEKCCGEGAEE